jgi:hypothetical protein
MIFPAVRVIQPFGPGRDRGTGPIIHYLNLSRFLPPKVKVAVTPVVFSPLWLMFTPLIMSPFNYLDLSRSPLPLIT